MWGLVERGGVAQGTGRVGGREVLARKDWSVPASQWRQGGASVGPERCSHWARSVSSSPSPAPVPEMPSPSSQQMFCIFASPILFVKVTMTLDARAPQQEATKLQVSSF